jgi:N-acetylmuramoyl-L-alanine amidase
MPDHVIQQGECLIEIAERAGHLWQTIWEHPENERLRREREDPSILAPGDRVFIPELTLREESIATNRSHRFRVARPHAVLRLRLLDWDGHPRKGLAYTLDIDGDVRRGATDGDGKIEERIPPRAGRAVLRVEDPARDPARRRFQRPAHDDAPEEYVLSLGSLDPITTTSGVRMRLLNLGYLRGSFDDPEEALRAAIRSFQESRGREPTGRLDEALAADLEAQHGC